MIARVLAVLACVAAAACVFPTDTCACTRVAPSGVVEGRVLSASGAPAAGVLITISAAASSCPAASYTATLYSSPSTQTSDAGEYTIPVALTVGATAACVRVSAQRPGGTPVVAVPVRLTLGGTQADRVRVDIQLPD
jgi:hypothetical protein